MKENRHAPNRFKSYQQIHETVINRYRQDFIEHETIHFDPYPDGYLISGQIFALDGIVITVEKFLEILGGSDDNAIVQTRWYSYNASLQGRFNILRYDNQDEDYLRPGHLDEHHKHVFDWKTGAEVQGSPFWVGHDGWPTLGDVINELQGWYYDNLSELSALSSYALLAPGIVRLPLNYEG